MKARGKGMVMDYINKFKIKTSDTQEMKMVFTAQSKQFFYCRDVVCEYVLKRGFLPINPFRVFDYFLGDRVDRNIVRRGNNQLIKTCDELWVFGSIADGVLFEIFSAINQNKPVKFFTIGSEIKEIREISVDEITFEPQVHAAQIKKKDIISFIKTGNVKGYDDLSGQISFFDIQQDDIQVSDKLEIIKNSAPSQNNNNTNNIGYYDVAVIGLGPSGMMALNYLADSSLRVIGIDMGKAPFQRGGEPFDISAGFGGSGLFSDGKLSFYPSGSNMWANLPPLNLQTAYGIMKTILNEIGCFIPEWSNEWIEKYNANSKCVQKKYESIYLDTGKSKRLVQNFYKKLKNNILLETEVKEITRKNYGYQLMIGNSDSDTIYAKNLIFATGKLGNSIMDTINEDILYNTKYEGGVRIETASENFIPIDYNQADFKIIEKLNKDTEIRTFCSCKNGIVIKSSYMQHNGFYKSMDYERISSYNGGVSDHITGRSNIGITIRTGKKNAIFTKEFTEALKKNNCKKISLLEFDEMHNSGMNLIGTKTDIIIRSFIKRVIKSDNERFNTVIYWPEVEYLGKYPMFDYKTLRIPKTNIWVAGDITGQFRGLIPSIMSGIIAALNIEQVENKK